LHERPSISRHTYLACLAYLGGRRRYVGQISVRISCLPIQRLPGFYGTRPFTAVFRKSPEFVLLLTQIKSVHALPSHFCNDNFHLRLGLSGGLYPSGLPTLPAQTLYAFLFSLLFVLHHLPISSFSFSSLYHWRSVQIMKLLITHFSLIPCYFLSTTPECSSQHPILGHSVLPA